MFNRRVAREVDSLRAEVGALTHELDDLRSRLDLDPEMPARFVAERREVAYQAAFGKSDPLVSVCVATYNRAAVLAGRCLPSLVAQTYRHLEILVVGDACTDDTEAQVRAIGDDRIIFTNLPERGQYPNEPMWRWMVAGTVPMNHALARASGDFVTHLDDDDEFLPGRMEAMLDIVRRDRADLAWHPFWYQNKADEWKLNPARELKKRHVTTSSIFYHRWLARIPWDIEAWRFGEPGDWNRLRKIRYLGAKTARHPEPLLRHYRERSGSA